MTFVGTFKFAKNLSFLKLPVGDGFDIGVKKVFIETKYLLEMIAHYKMCFYDSFRLENTLSY